MTSQAIIPYFWCSQTFSIFTQYMSVNHGYSTNDAKHPSTTRTDTPSPPQAPRGPLARARARNIENEVTSFLSEFFSVSLENGILPQRDTLCVLRYIGDHREEARMKAQAPAEQEKEEEVEKNEGEKSLYTPGSRKEGPRVPDPEDVRRGKSPGHPGCPATLAPGAWCLLHNLLLVDVFGPTSAHVCRTVANFPQVDDLRFINP